MRQTKGKGNMKGGEIKEWKSWFSAKTDLSHKVLLLSPGSPIRGETCNNCMSEERTLFIECDFVAYFHKSLMEIDIGGNLPRWLTISYIELKCVSK